MAKEIPENFEFSRNWEDKDDFPTRQYSESVVRSDIQYLFDELKSFLNDTVISVINKHGSRIAALGGGGVVEHEAIAENAIGTENIIDGSITESKYALDSIPAGVLKDESISNDCIPDGEISTDKIRDDELDLFAQASCSAFLLETLEEITGYPAEDGRMGNLALVRIVQQVMARTDLFRLGVGGYLDEWTDS